MASRGSILVKGGYNRVALPKDHPFRCMCDSSGCVAVHRLVMAEALGRPLRPAPLETVHHKNGHRYDNRLANLELRIGDHGPGQVVEDRVADALRILRLYAPEFLAATVKEL
jgi:hypothetical protein